MDRRSQEKSLRRLVADLAQARPEDVEAVLDELSPDQRQTVRELLDAYRGLPSAPPQAAWPKGAIDAINLQGFSSAIAERAEPANELRPPAWRMTEAAAGALRACARKMPPEPPPPPRASGGRRRPWFLGGAG